VPQSLPVESTFGACIPSDDAIALASTDEADSQLERGRALGTFGEREARKLQERIRGVRRILTALHRAVSRRADEDEGTDAGTVE